MEFGKYSLVSFYNLVNKIVLLKKRKNSAFLVNFEQQEKLL